ncbi:hypothetical protein OGAPHI_003851 [Ogataea philodendri]|uniref:Uncharacterized protein n=1 Tax=Ogataea philodendri TaxID=1378263 RepID=A0A9P8P4K6_9ASCO|nr:uncharacterized protein OGAPHI_003851 [Ogataea philodendri]KAH3665663.1 hypothetical protein OGAPHI_003851 [Ogataea philodendri]
MDRKRQTLIALLKDLRKGQIELPQPLVNSLFALWLPFIQDKEVQSCLLDGKNSKELTSMLIQSYTLKRDYDAALSTIEVSTVLVDRFPCELLAYHLILAKQFEKVFKLIDILYSNKYPQILNQQLLEILVKTALDGGQVELVSKFVVGFVFLFDRPLMTLSDELSGRLCHLSIERLDFATFAKTVDYRSKLIAKVDPAAAREFQRQMDLVRLKGYVRKLGAARVLESGMFFNMHFQKSEFKVADFAALTHGLAAGLDRPLDISRCVLLIEQMHGFHLNEHRNRYSSSLHPDHQLYRQVTHTANQKVTLDDLKSEYTALQTSLGKPNRSSEKSRLRKTVSSSPFHVLPLNLVLKTISISHPDFELALRLTNVMVRKRRCQLNDETLYYLLRIFDQCQLTDVESLASFLSNFELTAKTCRLVLEIAVRANARPLVEEYYNLYKRRNYYVSPQLEKTVASVISK